MQPARNPISPRSALPVLAGYGFAEPTYTQTPNEIFAAIPWLTEGDLKVLMVLVRYTLGYHRTTCDASYGDLATATCLTRRYVIKTCNRLRNAGMITRTHRFPKCHWQINIVETSHIKLTPGEPTQPAIPHQPRLVD